MQVIIFYSGHTWDLGPAPSGSTASSPLINMLIQTAAPSGPQTLFPYHSELAPGWVGPNPTQQDSLPGILDPIKTHSADKNHDLKSGNSQWSYHCMRKGEKKGVPQRKKTEANTQREIEK